MPSVIRLEGTATDHPALATLLQMSQAAQFPQRTSDLYSLHRQHGANGVRDATQPRCIGVPQDERRYAGEYQQAFWGGLTSQSSLSPETPKCVCQKRETRLTTSRLSDPSPLRPKSLAQPLQHRAHQPPLPTSYPARSHPDNHARMEIRDKTHLHHIEIKVVPRVLRNESGLRFIHGGRCEWVKRARRDV